MWMKFFKLFLLFASALSLVACSGGGSGGNSCNMRSAEATFDQANNNFTSLLSSLSGENNSEFSPREATLSPIFPLASFLDEGTLERTLNTTEINTLNLGNQNFSSSTLSTSVSSTTNSLSLLDGVGLVLEVSNDVRRSSFVNFNVELLDLTITQLINPQLLIDSNAAIAPNADQFVFGIVEARVRNTAIVTDECGEFT